MSNNSIRLLINYIEKFKILNCKITLNIAKKICTNISYFEGAFKDTQTRLIQFKNVCIHQKSVVYEDNIIQVCFET